MGTGTSSEPSGARPWIEAERGPVASIAALPGGAGRRRYWRVLHRDGTRSVLMHAVPEDPAILPPALRAAVDLPVHASPFVRITVLLERHGVPVPALYACDDARRWILLEDLGEVHLLDLPDAPRRERTRQLVELLAGVHAIPGEGLPFRREFDADWVGFELRLFLERIGDAPLRDDLLGAFGRLAHAIAALPRVLSLRDVQSQNVLVDAHDSLRLIDYQDALLAPRELDLAALLHDSYVEIDAGERDALLERYAVASGVPRDRGAFAMLAVQRKCKDLSRYQRLVEAGADARYAAARTRAARAILESGAALPEPVSDLAPLLARALSALGAAA